MNFAEFLDQIMAGSQYRGQVVHVQEIPPRPARYGR